MSGIGIVGTSGDHSASAHVFSEELYQKAIESMRALNEYRPPVRPVRGMRGDDFTEEEYQAAIDAMIACNEYHPPARGAAAVLPADRQPTGGDGDRPGDHFNRDGSWADVLEPHGWRVHHTTDRVAFWTRPGKDPRKGLSATTGFCRGEQTGDRLYVFTSSAPPFEPNTSYSKFAAFALLEHGGITRRRPRRCGPTGTAGRRPPGRS